MRHTARVAAEVAAIITITATGPAHAVDPAQSATVLGPANPQLSAGAAALEAGHVEEGIRLTLEGLREPSGPLDRAAGYSNLCAGYAMLKRWTEALPHCNTAIELNHSNWRAFNNRAGVYAATAQFELALKDIRAGLDLAPNSQMLLESLRVIEHNRRMLGSRRRSPS